MKAEGVALVTGAGRGLGRAVAVELAARGFDVVATMRNPQAGEGLAQEVSAAGRAGATAASPGSIRVETLDVTAPGDFALPADLRVLVNNAGVRLGYWPVEHQDEEAGWRETFETNVYGLVAMASRAVPVMRSGGGGVICNVTSSSILAAFPFFGAYRGSKAAASAVSETLAVEVAPFGIRVLEVLPGPIDTDLLRDSIMFRPPEAIGLPAYEPMATSDVFSRTETATVTSPADAARSIVDDILDDDAPLKVGCDPVSKMLLERWRTTSDVERMAATRAMFGID